MSFNSFVFQAVPVCTIKLTNIPESQLYPCNDLEHYRRLNKIWGQKWINILSNYRTVNGPLLISIMAIWILKKILHRKNLGCTNSPCSRSIRITDFLGKNKIVEGGGDCMNKIWLYFLTMAIFLNYDAYMLIYWYLLEVLFFPPSFLFSASTHTK